MTTCPQDWIEFEEIADLEERAKSQFFEKAHEEVVLKTQEAAKEKEFQSVPAGPAGAVEVSFSLPAITHAVYKQTEVLFLCSHFLGFAFVYVMFPCGSSNINNQQFNNVYACWYSMIERKKRVSLFPQEA